MHLWYRLCLDKVDLTEMILVSKMSSGYYTTVIVALKWMA